MASEIALRRVDLQALISSPDSLAWRRISLGTVNHPGLPVRKYLSGGLILTAEQRSRLSAKIAELRSACESDDSQENKKARLGLLANLLMAYPMAGGSEETGKARAGAYLAALDDIPPWAIAEAVRRWHRGEGGSKDSNYRFAPAPAELRFAAMRIIEPATSVIAHLESVLNAMTIEEAMDPSFKSPERSVVVPMRKL